MTDVLLDTSGAFALIIGRDQFHRRARLYATSQRNLRFHVPEVVLAETYTTLRRRQGYATAMRWATSVMSSSTVTVHRPTGGDLDQAWAILREFSGVPLSYADASLIALARKTSVDRVFSFDADFERCGLRLVPGM